MIENIGIFHMAGDMARHAADRQSHIARNVANADTPGYRATDIPDFAAMIETPGLAMKATRPGHIVEAADSTTSHTAFERDTEAAPNGNTVSLETEMMQAVRVRDQHDMALSIYASARDVVRTSLGR